jgi:hypothetical protein
MQSKTYIVGNIEYWYYSGYYFFCSIKGPRLKDSYVVKYSEILNWMLTNAS